MRIQASLYTNYCLQAEWDPDDEQAVVTARSHIEKLMANHSTVQIGHLCLYSLACTYAVASRIPALAADGFDQTECARLAKQAFMRAALIHNQWWIEGREDPDLQSLHIWMDAAQHIASLHSNEHQQPDGLNNLVDRIVADADRAVSSSDGSLAR
jgi:hypothetical protein